MTTKAIWSVLLVVVGFEPGLSAFLVPGGQRHWRARTLSFGRRRHNASDLRQRLLTVVSSSPSSSSSSSSTEQMGTSLHPIPAEWRGEVLHKLKSVIDPDLGSDIVSLGFIQDLVLDEWTRTVSFNVELTTPACPVKDQFASDCQRLVQSLPWVASVQVTMTAQPTTSLSSDYGMSQVGAVIAVSSCKGGVGKSTTAVNLAYALQALGATVGIFDADVYGPSLPTMVKPDDDVVRFVGRQIAPLQRNGVRLMSFGYVNEGSAVMRGPMVTQLLDQFLNVVHWGPLDYLVIDMPPGTGDIPLTLTQRLNITAAVIVTTPQELSFVDVVRGVEMFDSVQVPCVAVVENMAYYEPPPPPPSPALDRDCLKQAIMSKLRSSQLVMVVSQLEQLTEDLVKTVLETSSSSTLMGATNNNNNTKIPIFGTGHKRRLSEQWGIEHTYSMPLLEQIAAHGDNGTPFVLAYPNSPSAAIYQDLAKAVVTEVAKIKYSGNHSSMRPRVEYEPTNRVIRVTEGPSSSSSSTTITPADLRRGCRCAACVEEMTGRQLLAATDVPESIRPLRMSPTGNYAVSVDWSDGHRSLYPYRQIRAMIQDKEATQRQRQQQQKPKLADKEEQVEVAAVL